MDGLKVNAKERQGGSHLGMLRNGIGFLRARWLKCSKILSWKLAFENRRLFLEVYFLHRQRGKA